MAIQISTNDIDNDGFFTTTFTGDDTGQRLKGRIRCPRQGRPVVDYFYVSVTDPPGRRQPRRTSSGAVMGRWST